MKQPPKQQPNAISMQTLKRLPNYYNYLRTLQKGDVPYISAPAIARELGLNDVQVRKDLSAVSNCPGTPRKGFAVEQLMDSIAQYLGYRNNTDAILVGAGKLGKALLAYQGFEEHGVRIVAAFDSEDTTIGTTVGQKKILPMHKLPSLCSRMNIRIAIIAVPIQQAQEVCDFLVNNNILAIWNFAPIHLRVPKKVLVQNENLATQLALLSQHLTDQGAAWEEQPS